MKKIVEILLLPPPHSFCPHLLKALNCILKLESDLLFLYRRNGYFADKDNRRDEKGRVLGVKCYIVPTIVALFDDYRM